MSADRYMIPRGTLDVRNPVQREGQEFSTQDDEMKPVYSRIMVPFGNSNQAADPSLLPRNVNAKSAEARKQQFESDLAQLKQREISQNYPRPSRLPEPVQYQSALEKSNEDDLPKYDDGEGSNEERPSSQAENEEEDDQEKPVATSNDVKRILTRRLSQDDPVSIPSKSDVSPFIPRAVAQNSIRDDFEALEQYFRSCVPQPKASPKRDQWGTLREPEKQLEQLDIYGEPIEHNLHPDLYSNEANARFRPVYTKERPSNPKEAYELDWGLFMVSKDEKPYRVEVVQQLLRHRADPNAVDEYGMTPMHHAAAYGKVELIKLFAFYGGNVDQQDNIGWTPLYFAARNNEVEAARTLLDEGANPVRKTQRGRTARMLAVERGNWEVAKMIRQAQQEQKLDENDKKHQKRDTAHGGGINMLFGALSSQVFGGNRHKLSDIVDDDWQ